jgi:hypothetical protein
VGDSNNGSKRDGRTAYSVPAFERALLNVTDPTFRRELLGKWRPAPTVAERHPGPWYVRPARPLIADAVVFVVLDHHNACVCECDEQSVADAIARSWESIQ